MRSKTRAERGAESKGMFGMLFEQVPALFSPKERRTFAILLVMMIAASFLEVAGISSILPLAQVLSTPDLAGADNLAGRIYRWSGIQRQESFVILVAAGVLLIVVLSNAFLILTKTLETRFVWRRNYSIARELVSRYLQSPYTFFIANNSADLSKNVLTEVSTFINSLLAPLMDTIAKTLTSLFILGLLVAMDPSIAIAVTLVLGGFYVAVLAFVQGRLRRMGERRVLANAQLFTSVSHAFGGIKEIKVLGREDIFLSDFTRPALEYSNLNTRMTMISIIPRYVLEVIAYAAVVGALFYLLRGGRPAGEVLPVLALYAMAGFRLMPYFQNIYAGIARVRFNLPALNHLHRDYIDRTPVDDSSIDAQAVLPFERHFELRDVRFAYQGEDQDVLRGFSLKVRKGSIVGIAGTSGSGKTTTVDTILGLLTPQHGGLFVDDTPIGPANVKAWQRHVGYVPQEIYLIDATIRENIALGVAPESIDVDRVRAVAKVAMLHEFLETLPASYETVVGERGVRLSGGQRQRIGIARALYHAPDLLILDEATGALDGVTEKLVIDGIRSMKRPSTVIMISHRLPALRVCDEIHLFESGSIVTTGTYDALVQRSQAFRSMAHAT